MITFILGIAFVLEITNRGVISLTKIVINKTISFCFRVNRNETIKVMGLGIKVQNFGYSCLVETKDASFIFQAFALQHLFDGVKGKLVKTEMSSLLTKQFS